LYYAFLAGLTESVKQLLDKSANVNAQGGQYSNALQAASVGGHEKIAEMLIEKGAQVNAQGRYYGNAFQAASQYGHHNLAPIVLKRGVESKSKVPIAPSAAEDQSVEEKYSVKSQNTKDTSSVTIPIWKLEIGEADTIIRRKRLREQLKDGDIRELSEPPCKNRHADSAEVII
jgi:ankyrin repeat protein